MSNLISWGLHGMSSLDIDLINTKHGIKNLEALVSVSGQSFAHSDELSSLQ